MAGGLPVAAGITLSGQSGPASETASSGWLKRATLVLILSKNGIKSPLFQRKWTFRNCHALKVCGILPGHLDAECAFRKNFETLFFATFNPTRGET
jgi:hypothetical protein